MGRSMHPGIGDLIAPYTRLGIDIVQIGKGPTRPEVIADVMNAAFFDFSFGRGIAHAAGIRSDMKGTQEMQVVLIEANDVADPFNDRGFQIVVNQFGCGSAKKNERVEQRSHHGFFGLAMGKFQVKHSGMTFDHGHAV